MSTILAPPTPVAVPIAAEEDGIFTIPGVSWEQYVVINDTLDNQPNVRTLFLDGSLTFVSPGYIHEWAEDAIDKILLAVAVGCDIEMSVIGSTTLRKGEGTAGLEGDRAYYLGANVAKVGRPEAIDLAIHPPPDLAIEVENTHRATDALAIYAQLGVPEVWRHDVRRGTLIFLGLRADATFEPIPRSLGFPFLTPADVLFQIEQAAATQNLTRWFGQLTAWVRDAIRPRLDPA